MAKSLFSKAVEQARGSQAAHAAQKAKLASKRRKRNDGEAAEGGAMEGAHAGEGAPQPSSGTG
eukprot:8018952-Pyramimonas_sp.AAC.1